MKFRVVTSIAVGALVLATSTSAFAQRFPAPEGTRRDRHAYDSPQNFALELRFGLYRPDVDSDPALGGREPYRDSFGPNRRAMLGLELDWQALRIPKVGTLGPGIGVATTTASRPATTASGQASSEEMSFTVNPFSGLAVFRLDVFDREGGVPIVPYAKAGLVYSLWRASTTAGTSEVIRNDGSTAKGRGATWGYAVAAGLALDLGAIDERSARGLDQSTGINHTYVFGEWMITSVDGLFGQDRPMRLGDSTWNAGLAFEF